MKDNLRKQRTELQSNLKGYLGIVAGNEAKKELDNEDYMLGFILPYAPEAVAIAYWSYRSIDFEINDCPRRKKLAAAYDMTEEEMFA